MIGRWSSDEEEEVVEPKAFDDFELRLGDVMRGERATMGKSLLDVQRELRIKACYIAAIEDCDPEAFDTPGFIAGYVRSYARYLGMDADEVFTTFCEESGFAVAHGMSDRASVVRKTGAGERGAQLPHSDIFSRPNPAFVPEREGFFSRIEPAAIGSTLVLLALIAAIGFGGYSVLQEVQRVQVSQVDQTPVVLSELDPLGGMLTTAPSAGVLEVAGPTSETPRAEAFDRLYRPQALEVPVLVARDAPISTLDPRSIGSFAQPARAETEEIFNPVVDEPFIAATIPQVSEPAAPSLRVVAVRPSWVRARASDGSVIFEAIMEAGDVWDAPLTEEPPTLRTGESSAIYFELNGEYYGPVGERGRVTSNIALSVESLKENYNIADLSTDDALATTVVELQATLE